MDKDWEVEIYPDGRKTLIPPTFTPYSRVKGVWFGGRPTNSQSKHEFMLRADYRKTLTAWYREKLRHIVVDFVLCRFVTLTLDRDMSWYELLDCFTRFMAVLSRAFPNTEYLRAVEVQKGTQRFHIHIVLLFSGAVPKSFNLDWVNASWKCGMGHIRKKQVDEGAFQYLCKDKEESNSKHTLFPRGRQVIAISRNFGKIVMPTKSRMASHEAERLIGEQMELYKAGLGDYVRIDMSWFPDIQTGEMKKHRNRIYLRGTSDKKNEKEK